MCPFTFCLPLLHTIFSIHTLGEQRMSFVANTSAPQIYNECLTILGHEITDNGGRGLCLWASLASPFGTCSLATTMKPPESRDLSGFFVIFFLLPSFYSNDDKLNKETGWAAGSVWLCEMRGAHILIYENHKWPPFFPVSSRQLGLSSLLKRRLGLQIWLWLRKHVTSSVINFR